MNYKSTTMVPNTIFDNLLPSLSEKELKVLLIILRQTIGWVSKNGKRKSRDWISHRYFINITGLSRKSITQAISLLIKKGFIRAETISHQTLESSNDRKG
jgi:phage replication O-like protein O